MSVAPRMSSGPGCRSSLGLAMIVRMIAMIATGTLIQKIERQVHWVRYPPAIGPIAVRPPEIEKKIASALPRSLTS